MFSNVSIKITVFIDIWIQMEIILKKLIVFKADLKLWGLIYHYKQNLRSSILKHHVLEVFG